MSLMQTIFGSPAGFGTPTKLEAIFGAKPPIGTPPFAPPPATQTGGAAPVPAPGQAQHGISGFLERFFNPTSGLGQFGQALIASGGDPGTAMQYMMQQRAASGPKLEHVGDQIGIIDPRTGQFTPTYTPKKDPTGFSAELVAAGIDPASPEGQQMLHQKVENALDPFISTPEFTGPRSLYLQQRARLPGAIAVPAVPENTLGADLGTGDTPNWGGAGGNASGGFRGRR